MTEWYRLPHEMAYYGEDFLTLKDLRIHELVIDTIELADNDVDFRLYDFVMIVHSGSGQEVSSLLTEVLVPEVTNRIWSSTLSNLNISTNDGTILEEVAVVPEQEREEDIRFRNIPLRSDESHDVLGVLAHEFGHLLGLPDLYDKEKRWGEDTLVGKWDLMSSGAALNNMSRPSHPTAWSKIKLGWLSFKTMTPNEDAEIIQLAPLEVNREESAVVISLSDSIYYVVELRLKIGFDDYLPDEGILITFVDETDLDNPQVEIVDNNSDTDTKDDATFHFLDEYKADGFNLVVIAESQSHFTLGMSSQPFSDKKMKIA